jgi:hypothetical protein
MGKKVRKTKTSKGERKSIAKPYGKATMVNAHIAK